MWIIGGLALSGEELASVEMADLVVAILRERMAEEIGCAPFALRLLLSSGDCLENTDVGDALLRAQCTEPDPVAPCTESHTRAAVEQVPVDAQQIFGALDCIATCIVI